MPSIRILIANHQPIVRSGLRFLLERQPGFQVVGEGATGQEAIILAEFSHPDIVLLEIKLPQVSGIKVARRLSSIEGSPKLLFVTAHTEEGYVIEAFKAGARGYVAGDSAATDLPRAIHVVSSGRFFLSPAICSRFLDGPARIADISDREKELGCLLAAGYDEVEIAALFKADVEKIRADCRSFKHWSQHNGFPETLAHSVFA